MHASAALQMSPISRATTAGLMDDFRAVYDEHLGLVYRTLRRFGIPDPALDDAVQDVFTIVYTKRKDFEGRSSVKTWIFGIARRVARNHRPSGRETVAEGDLSLKLEGRIAERAEGEKLEQTELLYHLLSKLAPELREIFLLVELEQFTVREASEVLEANANTLSSRLRKAKADLKAELARMTARETGRAS